VERLKRIRTALKILWRNRSSKPGRFVDVVFVGGLVMVSFGFGWIYPPAFLIVGGLAAAALAWHYEPREPLELTERERELLSHLRSDEG
jgi:hypothetical protein